MKLHNLLTAKKQLQRKLMIFANSKDIAERMSYEWLYKEDEEYYDAMFDELQALSREIEIHCATYNSIANRTLIREQGNEPDESPGAGADEIISHLSSILNIATRQLN